MSPSELAELFDANPQQAFRLTLNCGTQVLVDNPQRTLIESIVLYVGLADDPDARVADRTKIISIPNITMVERVDRRRRQNGRRRRS
jgi:hypothetical protein